MAMGLIFMLKELRASPLWISRSEFGIGLGLSLAKVIAEAFGGAISVNSILKKGSEFTVMLPDPVV